MIALSRDLREQALRALRELLSGFQTADRAEGCWLLDDYPGELRQGIYAGLVVALMRIVFLLYVEGRGLGPSAGASEDGAPLARLYAELREDRVRLGPALDGRYGAWARVLALFRGLALVRGLDLGASTPGSGVPHGGLFDLAAYPFLEGRPRGSAPPEGEPSSQGAPPEPPRVSDGCVLRVLDQLLVWRAEPLRYGDLDVELIGGLYEGLKGFVLEVGEGGTLELLPGAERRRAGSYYTPRTLAAEVVERAIRPLLQHGAHGAGSPAPDEILALRVCDPAMGSGAFLVEACRRLADHLAKAWQQRGSADGDDLVRVRGLVARRCLYGVDLDPLAVDLARASLWLFTHASEPPATFLGRRFRWGNSLLGAEVEELGLYPAGAFRHEAADLDARARLRAFRRRCDLEARARPVAVTPPWIAAAGPGELRRALDAWTALWFWPAAIDRLEAAPTPAILEPYLAAAARADLDDLRIAIAQHVAEDRRLFHWQLEFPDVFSGPDPGFDAIVGNPPWIAYVGRAAQPIEPEVRNFLVRRSPAFRNFRSLHGVFVHRAASLLRRGGRLGLVLPTSVSDLHGYEPVRRAHDALSVPDPDLPDFGAGAFDGVFQPCMALLSTRRGSPRLESDPGGLSWPLARTDLDPVAARLLSRLSALSVLPASLFGERGYQTQGEDAAHLHRNGSEPPPPHARPIREGTDIGEFIARPPRYHIDAAALKGRFRSDDEWRSVRLLIRQTARFPIAALSDGLPFRNSILAGFATGVWGEFALLCWLNASPVRWFHYTRNRDARQGMPQIKIAHLRALPGPSPARLPWIERLDAMGRALGPTNAGISCVDRGDLDELVADMLELTPEERQYIAAWRDSNPTPRSDIPRPPPPP